jgi:hypothetical protein
MKVREDGQRQTKFKVAGREKRKPKGSQASDEEKRKLKQPAERNERQSCRLRDTKTTSGLRIPAK